MSDEQIRLPELPVFKRFSLALRQEYATASEILSMLDRTTSRIETLLKKAEEESRKAEDPVDEEVDDLIPQMNEEDAELVPSEEGSGLLLEPGLDRNEEVAALFEPKSLTEEDEKDLGPLLPPEPGPLLPPELEPAEREGPLELGGPLIHDDEEEVESLIPPDDDEVESLIPPDDDEVTSLIGRGRTTESTEPSDAKTTAENEPTLAAKTGPASKPKAKPKPKRRKPAPQIVRVSDQGRPLKSPAAKEKAKGKSRSR